MAKSTFFTGQPIFTQLLNLVPRSLVDQLSRKHDSNRYCKRFLVYDHLVSMIYSGYFKCSSLRELTTGLQANSTKLHHLGLRFVPRRSTLSDANRRRNADFFADLYHRLYQQYFGLPDSCCKNNKGDRLFIIDSTTISLFTSVMRGAGTLGADGKKKGGAKAHMMVDSAHDIPAFIDLTEAKQADVSFLSKVVVPDGSTVVFDKGYISYSQFKSWNKKTVRWVTRLKQDAVWKHLIELPVNEDSYDWGVRRDQLVRLGRPSNKKQTPLIDVRLVNFYDEEKKRDFSFITNDLKSLPEEIAGLYKRRWQIETLFKRIKQCYPLRYFLGETPNAIKIQIWTALICDLLVRVIQMQINRIRKKPWAYASISSMIKHHLMNYLDLKSFLLNPEKALDNYKPPEPQLEFFRIQGAFI